MDLELEEIADSEGNFLYQDILFTNGRLATVDGIDEIKNRITIGLSIYLGENFTDPSYGTDYFNNVFGREVTDTVVIDELKSNILRTRGVTGLKTFELTRESGSRVAVMTAQVQTSQGFDRVYSKAS
jgi:hypothetical protein